MDGVGEGNLGMVTTFCHHDQANVEASKALSALYQCDLLEPSVVVVRRCTNSPYLPQGSFGFLYLDVTTLSGGASSSQFPLDQLFQCKLLPYSDTKMVLPREEGEEGLKVYSFFQESLWKSFKDSLITPHPHGEEGSQTEVGPGFHLAQKWWQGISWDKVQLKWELAHAVEELTRKNKDWQIRLARKHEKWGAQMAKEADATFHEVFSQTSSTDMVKLLPW